MCSLLIIPCNFPVFQYSGTWVFCASHVVCCAYQQALLQPCQLCRSFKFLHLGTASSDVSDHSSLHKVLSGRFCRLNCPDNSPHCFFSTHHEMESIVILITVINIVVIVMIIISVLATEVSTWNFTQRLADVKPKCFCCCRTGCNISLCFPPEKLSACT